MESELLQLIVVFVVGLICGALIMLLWNKLSSGSASAAGLKLEYQDYQEKVETHFEQTSKKFQDMTEQYQDLYKHLSVGATSLCRPDSVAATLADESKTQVKIGSKQASITPPVTAPKVASKPVTENKTKDPVATLDTKSAAKGSVKDSAKGESEAVTKKPVDSPKASTVEPKSDNKKKDSSA